MAAEKRLRRRPIHANSLDGRSEGSGAEADVKRQNRPPIEANPAKTCRGRACLPGGKGCLRVEGQRKPTTNA